MSNIKISQLPEYTGDTTGFYIPINNSGETETFKVLKETLFSGASGTSGTSGTSGINGTSGVSGSSGTSGVSGSSGTSGTSGINGTSGVSGSSGTSGVSGSSGTSGVSGSSGTSGVSGSSGTSGVSGSSGTSGVSGSSGTSGVSGSSGTSGVSGSSGTSGVSGSSGSSGKSTDVYSGGTLIVSGATILNFSGATITSGGTDEAIITITAGGSSSGESFIIVEVSDSPTTNGTNLLAAYAAAKLKTPYGNALAQSNRYTIILPPGIYDVGSTALSLDTNFIDIVGSTTDLANHQITSNITQFVSVNCNNVELRNLYILNNSTSYGFNGGGNRPGLLLDNIFFGYGANANPWQAVVETEFSGFASRVNAGQFYSLTGGASTTPVGNAATTSGTLSNIICNGGLADGAFNGFAFNCRGGGISFGGRAFYGNSTGFMMNCRGGNTAFANSPGGTYINCHGGDGAWAGNQATDLTGTYINCHSSAGATSFGQPETRTISGTMFFCSKRGGTGFAAPTGSGVIRLSIDGTNTITNLP
jgi:hypothetical protein